LALLNAGTVAFTITAVLGSLHGQVNHRYTLRAGLCSLVCALLGLLARNFVWTKYEAIASDARYPSFTAKVAHRLDKINDIVGWLGFLGIALMF
jgi:hypothetical protein